VVGNGPPPGDTGRINVRICLVPLAFYFAAAPDRRLRDCRSVTKGNPGQCTLRVLQLLPQLAGSRYPRSLAVSGDRMPPWIGSTSPFGPPLGETGKPQRRPADAGGYAGEGVWSPKATASIMTMAISAIHHNAARTLRRGGEACRRCSDILFAPRPVAALASC